MDSHEILAILENFASPATIGLMIRLFAAVALPDEVAEKLPPLQVGLPGARWRPRETLHVTLRFFGDVAEPVADDLDIALAAAGAGPFELVLQGVGAFGEGERVRTVWVGVAESPALSRLARACERAARNAGLKPETRNYAPHVTLAYLRAPEPEFVGRWLADHNLLHLEPFKVARFGLYSSWPGEAGSQYRLEQSYVLR